MLHETSENIFTMQTALSPDQIRFQKSFNLSAGQVFRRKDLAEKHPSVDRELGRYVRSGLVCKAAQGLYYVPKTTPFGQAPPDEEALVAKFLDDKRFLIFNPSSYNTTVVCTNVTHGFHLLRRTACFLKFAYVVKELVLRLVQHSYAAHHDLPHFWCERELLTNCAEKSIPPLS